MSKNSYNQIKKFTQFRSDCKDFDAKLEELQNSLYYTAHDNENDFSVYVAAQLVRDSLFRLCRKMRGVPDETNPEDFDVGGGEVVR